MCRQPEQDNGGLGGFSQSEDRAKIGVGGYQDAVFLSGAVENYLVVLPRHAVVSHMGRVVSRLSEPFRHRRGESTINQKPQG